MNILVIDTATEIEYISASISGKRAERIEQIPRTHAASLFKNIDDVLTEAGGTIHDVDLIAVGIGPGSFTGIRIAVTTARMLAQLIGASLMGLYSQEIFAIGTELKEKEHLLVAFDAKKNRVFGALYKEKEGEIECLVEPGDYPVDELTENIREGEDVTVTGSGIKRFAEEIERLPATVTARDVHPDTDTLIETIEKRHNDNPEEYRDINRVVPCYARRSDAEIAMEKKKKSSHP